MSIQPPAAMGSEVITRITKKVYPKDTLKLHLTGLSEPFIKECEAWVLQVLPPESELVFIVNSFSRRIRHGKLCCTCGDKACAGSA